MKSKVRYAMKKLFALLVGALLLVPPHVASSDVVLFINKSEVELGVSQSVLNLPIFTKTRLESVTARPSVVSSNGPYAAYLPIAASNFLHVSWSHYITSTDTSDMNTLGCQDGSHWPAYGNGVVILDFGQPWAVNGIYGARLIDYPNYPFHSNAEVASAFQFYVYGFLGCAPTDGFGTRLINQLNIALGVNNDGGYAGNGHGTSWAQLINSQNQWVSAYSNMSAIRVRGAFDAEPGFNWPIPTEEWVSGYSSAHQGESLYYNFGSCDSCPSIYYPTWVITNDWTLGDIHYVSWGAPAALPLPEIYNELNAWQWQYVTLYGYQTYGVYRIYIKGLMTEWGAC